MSAPKYKVGDRVTFDVGWEREHLVTMTITTVSKNHCGQLHRYYGVAPGSGEHGVYEHDIKEAK